MLQNRYLVSLLVALHAVSAVVSLLSFVGNIGHLQSGDLFTGGLSLGSLQYGLNCSHSSQLIHAHEYMYTHAVNHINAVHALPTCNFAAVHSDGQLDLSYRWDNLDLRLLISGQPPHPGPHSSTTLSLLVWNINSLSKFLPVLSSYDFDVCFAQEISTPWSMLSAIYSRLRERKFKALLTGTDPETLKTGGVTSIFGCPVFF